MSVAKNGVMSILVVDDERPARTRLCTLLDDETDYRVVGEAATGHEALQACVELQPDIVLLDIRMPGLDGIETAHHLNALEAPPAVVFATAYDEYAVAAFEARAIGYVLKPVRRRKLLDALAQASRVAPGALGDAASDAGLAEPRRHIGARRHGELRLIPVSDVVCFHADQKYVAVAHDDGPDLIDESLKSLESEFGTRFVRIHRGALVAVDCIDRLEKDPAGKYRIVLRAESTATVSAEYDLTISRRHLSNVRKRLRDLSAPRQHGAGR